MRHYNCGPLADAWHEKTDQGTVSWDLCKSCGLSVAGQGAADHGLPRGWHSEPLDTISEGEYAIDYEDVGIDMTCDICGCKLTDDDN